MIIGERGGFPVCLAEFPWMVSQGQTVVLGSAVVLGVLAALLYRRRTRGRRYLEQEEEQEQ